MEQLQSDDKILSIDIGGSRIKATVLDPSGNILKDYQRISTPKFAGPLEVVNAIVELTKDFLDCTRISVGFPGYVRGGIVHTAPNLGTNKWSGFNLKQQLTETLNKPVRVVNDADLQGLGVASGVGLELVITLGTGFGTALLMNGTLLPHLEVAHHPVTKSKTYDEFIGNRALESIGLERWNRRMRRVLAILKTVVNYDRLYISGGNAKRINFILDRNVTVVTNLDGIKGGAKLWALEHQFAV